MNCSTAPPPNKPDPYRDRLTRLLAEALRKVEQYKAALAVHDELAGKPSPLEGQDAAPVAPRAAAAAARPGRKGSWAGDQATAYNRAKAEAAQKRNRLDIARVLLEAGETPYTDIARRYPDRNHNWLRRTFERDGGRWFTKAGPEPAGGPGADKRPWCLTPTGRREAAALIAAFGAPAEGRQAARACRGTPGRPRNAVPTYCKHPRHNSARCWVDGRWVNLGPYDSPESRAEFARICAGAGPATPISETPKSVPPVKPPAARATARKKPPAKAPPAKPDESKSPPAPALRENPILDAEFEDLFLPGAARGFPVPRPGLNGTGMSNGHAAASR